MSARGKVDGWQIFLTVCFLLQDRGGASGAGADNFRHHGHINHSPASRHLDSEHTDHDTKGIPKVLTDKINCPSTFTNVITTVLLTGPSKAALKKGGKLLSKTLEKANQLLEVKAALEQLSIDGGVQSSSVCTYSSMSEDNDSDGESGVTDQDQDQRHNRVSRKEREASHETLSTTITSADEFVWIDSHNR